jgi:phosphoenolpyruvate carboxykinase (ATP)
MSAAMNKSLSQANLFQQANANYDADNISDLSVNPSVHGLHKHGLGNLGLQHWNLPTAALYEQAVQNNEAQIAHLGPLVTRTGKHTGRAAQDKFIVEDETSKNNISWGDVNKPMKPEKFDWLSRKVTAFLQNRRVYVMDCYAGADPKYRLKIRVITETAYHALFARVMLIRPSDEELRGHDPDFTVIHVPNMFSNPAMDGTRSATFITLSFARNLALIGGTFYAGEIKKTVFSAMNYYLPLRGVLTMHSSANVGKDGRTAIFFGLSGTGKTTLSADPERELIGDDEHGWCDDGIFNIEGGCYAKVINLNPKAEPDIYRTTQMFGTLIENVIMNPVTRRLDLGDGSLTENTRAAYPLDFIANFRREPISAHADNVIMLCCDAFGVLPPVSYLSPEQAQYYFLLGYTAKVAGTEQGVTKPTATFSACFGLPFMPLFPTVYAKLLKEKLLKHNTRVWLLNTGWTGGPPGVGHRMSIQHTRALLHAALDGDLATASTTLHPIFNLNVPVKCPGVPDDVLIPENSWSDKAAYENAARELAGLCKEAFKPYEAMVDEAVIKGGPL